MTTPSDRQLAAECDRFWSRRSDSGIPDDEIIQSQPRSLYAPPAFLKATAPTIDHAARFAELFDNIWSVNEQFVGERTREVNVYLKLTGQEDVLISSLEEHCIAYFQNRILKNNPKDIGLPFVKTLRLFEECGKIFRQIAGQPNCLNYIFTESSQKAVRYLLLTQLCAPDIGGNVSEYFLSIEQLKQFRPDLWDDYRKFCRDDHVLTTLRRVFDLPDHKTIVQDSAPTEVLKALCVGMANDISEMRPFLIRNFNPKKTIVELSDSLFVSWDWSVERGIGRLFVCDSRDESYTSHRTRQFQPPHSMYVGVSRLGGLYDPYRPWIDWGTQAETYGIDFWRANHFLLETIYKKLFGFFDKIDIARWREDEKRCNEDEITDASLAISCRDLAATAEDEPTDQSNAQEVQIPYDVDHAHRVGPLRFQRFVNVLKKLGCEVKPGRGSEFTAFRPGGKKVIIPHHTQNPKIPILAVQRYLKKLNISRSIWFNAVYEK